MPTLDEAVREFLASPRIAVAGVSRSEASPGSAIYKALKRAGHDVVATNPSAESVQGDPCYRDLRSVPGRIDAVVVATPPQAAPGIVRDCEALGIRRIWLHRSFGKGSVDDEAVRYGRERGMQVIAGACPLMYCQPVDPGHRFMRVILRWLRRLPKME